MHLLIIGEIFIRQDPSTANNAADTAGALWESVFGCVESIIAGCMASILQDNFLTITRFTDLKCNSKLI